MCDIYCPGCTFTIYSKDIGDYPIWDICPVCTLYCVSNFHKVKPKLMSPIRLEALIFDIPMMYKDARLVRLEMGDKPGTVEAIYQEPGKVRATVIRGTIKP